MFDVVFFFFFFLVQAGCFVSGGFRGFFGCFLILFIFLLVTVVLVC